MHVASLAIHEGLVDPSRLRWLSAGRQRNVVLEWAFLVGCGIIAAVASFCLDFRLGIPGHAILRTIFPMVFGLALLPRRGAGTVMGMSALATGLVLRGLMPLSGLSLGALTSVTLTGPLLDLSLRHARSGWWLYAQFALAGFTANLIAFLVRGGAKVMGMDHLRARPLAEWVMQASVSYAVCGLLAGLISGVIWFQAKGTFDKAAEE